LVLAVLLAAASCGDTGGGSLPLRRVADVALPGSASRFDYQDVDVGRRRLFIAHLGASRIDVVDLVSLRVVAAIPGVSQVHGVRVAPDLGRLYASATGSNEVVTFDEDTLAPLARAQAGGYPDGIAYVPTAGKVYVSNEVGGSETVIDARTGRLLGTVPVGGQAGNVAYDPSSGRVLVAVQTRNTLVAIDVGTDRVLSSMKLAGCDHDHGLYIDPRSSTAFVACDGNARLLVVDLRTMRVNASYRVGAKPDVLAFDAGLGRLYVACESGVVSVLEERGQTLRELGRAKLASGAHTVAVDAETHRVFFPLPERHPVLRVMAPR